MQKMPYRNKILRSKISVSEIRPDKKYLDSLWRKVALAKYGERCEMCGKADYLNIHHFFSRSRNSVRWDIDNAIVLCSGHHSLNNDSAHKDPCFKDRLLERGIRDKVWLDKLTLRAWTPAKLDLNLVKLDLENELKKFGPPTQTHPNRNLVGQNRLNKRIF